MLQSRGSKPQPAYEREKEDKERAASFKTQIESFKLLED